MPGEYDDIYGTWNFDVLNGQGYIAETVYGFGGKQASDGCAAVYGYENTLKSSRLSLNVFDEYIPEKFAFAFSFYKNMSERANISLIALGDDTSETKITDFEIAKDCKWNNYTINFDASSDVYTIYLNGMSVYEGKFEQNYISDFVFEFKSEEFEDMYAIDNVSLIY